MFARRIPPAPPAPLENAHMGQARIVLAGICPSLAGLTWQTDRLLRLGRQNHLEVVLRDFSIDRLHAEVAFRAAAGSCGACRRTRSIRHR